LAAGNAFVAGKNPPAGIMFDIMGNGAILKPFIVIKI
jgi:hypothetical protein